VEGKKGGRLTAGKNGEGAGLANGTGAVTELKEARDPYRLSVE